MIVKHVNYYCCTVHSMIYGVSQELKGETNVLINDANVMGNKIVDFYESLVRSGV